MSRKSWIAVSINLLVLLWCLLDGTAEAQNRLAVFGSRFQQAGLSGYYPSGSRPDVMQDDSKWLNYTILLKEQEPHYSITAQVAGGQIPPGITIRLRAGSYIGPGDGETGVPIGEIILSEIPQVIIENIGTCHTGNGLYVGHQLFYRIEISDYRQLETLSSTIQLVFTLTQ